MSDEQASDEAWRPLGDAWTVDEDMVEAIIRTAIDDANLFFLECGMPADRMPQALAWFERIARAKTAEAIASAQARLRLEARGGETDAGRVH